MLLHVMSGTEAGTLCKDAQNSELGTQNCFLKQETRLKRSMSASPDRPALPLSEANLRIGRLSRQPAGTCGGPEDLDRPLDPGFEISGDERAHKIVLKVGGVEVSWCRIVDFRQQIGSAVVRMGGMADVGTHDEHRFQGHGRRVMVNSLRWMRGAGYDVAMLYGIPGFYPKFGYAEAFPNVTHSLAVRDAELARPGKFRFVDFAPTHLDAVLKMYHANNAGRTGVTLRDPKKWAPFRKGVAWGPRPVPKVALDSRGRPAAYYAYDAAQHAEPVVLEVGCATPAVFGSLLREAAGVAWARRLERVKFLLPEDHAFVEFCRQFGLLKEALYRRDGGAMVRMINVPSALGKIAPVLAGRLAGERPGSAWLRRGKSGSLTIRTNLDDVTLSWRGGKLTVGPASRGSAVATPACLVGGSVRLPQWALAQLLYGYRDVETLRVSGAVSGSKDALAILAAMFPQGPHYHYRMDTF